MTSNQNPNEDPFSKLFGQLFNPENLRRFEDLMGNLPGNSSLKPSDLSDLTDNLKDMFAGGTELFGPDSRVRVFGFGDGFPGFNTENTTKEPKVTSYLSTKGEKVYEVAFAGYTPEGISISYTPTTKTVTISGSRTQGEVSIVKEETIKLDVPVTSDALSAQYDAGIVRVIVAPASEEEFNIPLTILS